HISPPSKQAQRSSAGVLSPPRTSCARNRTEREASKASGHPAHLHCPLISVPSTNEASLQVCKSAIGSSFSYPAWTPSITPRFRFSCIHTSAEGFHSVLVCSTTPVSALGSLVAQRSRPKIWTDKCKSISDPFPLPHSIGAAATKLAAKAWRLDSVDDAARHLHQRAAVNLARKARFPTPVSILLLKEQAQIP
ncbi:hypothetical protein K437DRAFT_250696, partial [Tilletiaria anomala UBC 951]